MKRFLKITACSLLSMTIMLSSMVTPSFAGEEEQNIADIEGSTSVAELDPNWVPKQRGLFSSYKVYADKWFYFNSRGIPCGAEGWTNLISKKDGSYIYHYTTARAWISDLYWDSERVYGTGKVTACTYDLGMGAISETSVYYGT